MIALNDKAQNQVMEALQRHNLRKNKSWIERVFV
jgi:hypothetical protein